MCPATGSDSGPLPTEVISHPRPVAGPLARGSCTAGFSLAKPGRAGCYPVSDVAESVGNFASKVLGYLRRDLSAETLGLLNEDFLSDLEAVPDLQRIVQMGPLGEPEVA
jgi:hypothetical protein